MRTLLLVVALGLSTLLTGNAFAQCPPGSEPTPGVPGGCQTSQPSQLPPSGAMCVTPQNQCIIPVTSPPPTGSPCYCTVGGRHYPGTTR